MKKTGIPRAGYNPKTGTNTEMRKKPPVLSDAAHTSSDAQKLITRPPMPFANKNSLGQTPPATKASGGVSTLEPKIQSGLKRTTVGSKALPSSGPIGQKKAINQSGQIGGRMGFPPPKRKAGMNGGGFPSKRSANFYGE